MVVWSGTASAWGGRAGQQQFSLRIIATPEALRYIAYFMGGGRNSTV
jgi:hypothetical protein